MKWLRWLGQQFFPLVVIVWANGLIVRVSVKDSIGLASPLYYATPWPVLAALTIPIIWAFRRQPQMVYGTCHSRGAKSVVDIHDAHAGGATVEHTKQRRNAAEARSVANAGRHSNHGDIDQTTNDARQRPFHTGDDDDDVGGTETVLFG